MNSDDIWKELHDLFDTDDGSLPEIRIANLSKQEVVRVFGRLQQYCRNINGTFWSKKDQEDRSIDSVPNAALLVTDGRAEAFHVLCSQLHYAGIAIPDLGVCVSDDEISLDYRMSSQWNSENLRAFFQLLKELAELSANARVRLEKGVLEDVRKKFEDTWATFMRNTAVTYGADSRVE